MSRHGSDVVGCAQPSERSARRIAQPIPSVLASDATPRCASMASADRQMIGDATLAPSESTPKVLEGTMHGLSSARATLAAPTPGRREKRRTNAHHWLTTDPRPAQGLHTQ
ncbi:hypothetical protein D5045_26415 [Verminephrobacter eiseniae]|uniref:hypothetical protein n=1 Tax=Verminephrobacter eiseniae TaxID=364317 RepID=UPI0022382153|nr:hypothetical protein [Verminephrobacter eiseniae]MCW5263530.1 hypothetical protein [Verminephrobacter eiseniae]